MTVKLAERPPFPSGWTAWEITPAEVSLANTLPVGQAFTWHRQPIIRAPKARTASSSSSSSSIAGQGFFVKQEDISDSESENEDDDPDRDTCEEEWSKAIEYGGAVRAILLRQTRGRIWFTSVLHVLEDGSEHRSAADIAALDKSYLLELFQLPVSSSSHPIYPSTPGLYKTFSTLDPNLFHLTSLRVGLPQGIRVLRQNPFETLIAFITSSANNVGRITGLMKRLGERYGREVVRLGRIVKDEAGTGRMADQSEGMEDLLLADSTQPEDDIQEYTSLHLFPTPSSLLADAELEQSLRALGFGYRANFISTTLELMREEHGVDGIEGFLEGLRPGKEGDGSDNGNGEERWRRELLRFKGVGRKVADCIGLMSLDRPNVVPIDTHLQQIAARHPSFPARLKGKPTSGEKVYKEVQGFLTDLWGGTGGGGIGLADQASEESGSSSSSSAVAAPSAQESKAAKRSPRKKRKIELAALPPNELEVSVRANTISGMGMAGWAQAVMFAADLKGSKAVKVENPEVEETDTDMFGGPSGRSELIIKQEVVTKRKTTTKRVTEALTGISDASPSIKAESSTASGVTTSRLQSYSGFQMVTKAPNADLFGGKSDIQAIRKNSAVHDIYNRLHSIDKDMEFVDVVRRDWYGGKYPVVANQRCGSWYCDPKTSSSQYAYFKSTDGHTGAWDFSVRRANLQLVDFVSRSGGLIIVDSTRRGKRMPDALSKTLPIWCTVVNRAIAARKVAAGEGVDVQAFLDSVQTPAEVVSQTEHAQIQARVEIWTQRLLSSSLTLPNLARPLRPYFVHPGLSGPPQIADDGFIPIICLSASAFIGHGGPESSMGRYGSFEYIQGSGDDHELWGQGLDAALFHLHREALLITARQDLPSLLQGLIRQGNSATAVTAVLHGHLDSATELIPGTGFWLSTVRAKLPDFIRAGPLLITVSESPRPSSTSLKDFEELYYQVDASRKGDVSFSSEMIPEVVQAVIPAIRGGRPVLIRDDNGKDVSVGLAVACLWHLFDDRKEQRPHETSIPQATKDQVRRRLDWILDKRQGANPARKTLQRVNTYLITPPKVK